MRLSILQFFAFLVVTNLFFSCQEDPTGPNDNPESLSLAERRELGDLIASAIEDPSSGCNIFTQAEFPDLNDHFNELYRQAYFITAEINGWDTSRPLKVIILKNDEQLATVLPGGHLVISQGMAKLFKKEYELIYLMVFEYQLMNEKHLLEGIAQFVENVADLREIAETTDRTRALEIGKEIFKGISYESQIVNEMDELTVRSICDNTNYKVDGLRAFWDLLDPSEQWLSTRESSINRDETVRDLMVNYNCNSPDKQKATSKGEDYYVNRILKFFGE